MHAHTLYVVCVCGVHTSRACILVQEYVHADTWDVRDIGKVGQTIEQA